MAALMTSVIDQPHKVYGYIYTCREMGIKVLPPDVNAGEGVFTTEDGAIRYGLYAIKSLGRNVVDTIIRERDENGSFPTLRNLLERVCDKEVNKKALENLIKAGACDSLDGTRKQMLLTYLVMLDRLTNERKKNLAGQMTLFDFVCEEEKKSFDVQYPDVGEFGKEEKLGFEKEVLGIYLSGHPLEDYENKWRKNTNAVTTDFLMDEDTGRTRIADGAHVMVGGMIAEKKVKFTRTNKTMAYLTVEDLYGTLEIIVFPSQYERYQTLLNEDEKVFIRGKADVEDDKNGRLVCEAVYSFAQARSELWLQFDDRSAYEQKETKLFELLHDSDGADSVVIYLSAEKAMKRLGNQYNIQIRPEIVNILTNFLGKNNVKVVEKNIEKNL